MKFNGRKAALAAPGVTGTARVGKPRRRCSPRLRAGDIAVIDHLDLDRDSATALVPGGGPRGRQRGADDLRPLRQPRAGGPGRGRRGAGRPGRQGGLGRIRDNQPIRIDDGVVYVEPTAGPRARHGRVVDLEQVHSEMEEARPGLAVQLDTLTHNTSEFLRREQELLLDGRGLPELTTRLAGRPVVVVGVVDHADLQAVGPFVREQAPVILAVGAAADDLLGLSWAPDVVVVTAGDPGSVPSADALRVATDVVLVAPAAPASRAGDDRGRRGPALARRVLGDRRGRRAPAGRPLRRGAGRRRRAARPARGVPRPPAGRPGQQLRHPAQGRRPARGRRAVPALYTGRPGALQVVLVLLAGLVALLAAIAVTPVGQDWAHDVADHLQALAVISLRHHVASLVAVFLALAVGIALGGGPLAERRHAAATSRPPRPPRRRRRPRTASPRSPTRSRPRAPHGSTPAASTATRPRS